MNNNIETIAAIFRLITHRLEQLIINESDKQFNDKLRELNEKVYELADTIETIEVMLE